MAAKKKSKTVNTASPWNIGKLYLIRTVTNFLLGKLVQVTDQELVLEDCAWVASTGRFAEALKSGKLDEVEPYPDGQIIVGRGALVDACLWAHPSQRTVL